jgi:hypothetical protein
MADLPPQSHPAAPESDDVGTAPDAEPTTTGAPRWVKAFGMIALVVVVLVVVLLLVGGGNHGPGRHSGTTEKPAPTGSVVESPGVGGHAARAAGHAP